MADAALSILDVVGQDIVFRREGEESLALAAVVSDYGLGPAPSIWPGEMFQGLARHAAFRIRPNDLPSGVRPQANDVLVWEDVEYTVNACEPEPRVYGPAGPMWWVCMSKADQRSLV